MESHFVQEALQYLKSIAQGINNPWAIWIPLMGVLVALLLGIVGIFQDWIRSWFRKPKLNVSIKVEPPDCHKTFFNDSTTGKYLCDTYYFRFRVENNGNYYAEDVEAMVVEVHKKINSRYTKVHNFLPLNILWSHYRKVTMPKIQPKLFKHLDLGYILKSNFVDLKRFGIDCGANIFFLFDVAVQPNTGSHILLPGDYKVKVVFASNNLRPQEKIYNIVIKDRWDDDEEKMLSENVSIKEVLSIV